MDLQAQASRGQITISTHEGAGHVPLGSLGIVFHLRDSAWVDGTGRYEGPSTLTVWVDPTDPGQCEAVQIALLDALDAIPGAWDGLARTATP